MQPATLDETIPLMENPLPPQSAEKENRLEKKIHDYCLISKSDLFVFTCVGVFFSFVGMGVVVLSGYATVSSGIRSHRLEFIGPFATAMFFTGLGLGMLRVTGSCRQINVK